ncbi:MAG: hydrogenase nickel incorporation protein HypB [Spirochaetales bacterium]|nr:hydrogenase nickel incorporation protein HypB [Spirochaetales bacterium]
MEIKVLKSLMEANENLAQEIRSRLKKSCVKMYNMISSPGSGKTSLLEETLKTLHSKYKLAVIEGDLTTDKDAQRLNHFEVPIVLINTQGGCHLNSNSILRAFDELDLDSLDIIFIENVGNLVCPSEFDLGENGKIAIVSVTEGDDKPAKYPVLFRDAILSLLNKIDLLPYVNFNKETFYREMGAINGTLKTIEISCSNKSGLDLWFKWIKEQMDQPRL